VIYERVFEKPPMMAGTKTLDPRYRVIRTGCKRADLEDCKEFDEFKFTYLDDDDSWLIDDTMKLLSMCRGNMKQSDDNNLAIVISSQEIMLKKLMNITSSQSSMLKTAMISIQNMSTIIENIAESKYYRLSRHNV